MSVSTSQRRQTEDERLMWCPSCGVVVEVNRIGIHGPAPWCRHNDPTYVVPAARMERLPSSHPMAKDPK